MVKKMMKWVSSYGTLIDGYDVIGDGFDTKEEAQTFDDYLKKIITGVKVFSGRKRLKVSTLKELGAAIYASSRVVFASIDVKQMYREAVSDYDFLDMYGNPENYLTAPLRYHLAIRDDNMYLQADEDDD